MPATGAERAVGDITQIEPNIHAGVKYMRLMMDRYYKDEPMDGLNKGLFAFASNNAGPARVRRLRQPGGMRGFLRIATKPGWRDVDAMKAPPGPESLPPAIRG